MYSDVLLELINIVIYLEIYGVFSCGLYVMYTELLHDLEISLQFSK